MQAAAGHHTEQHTYMYVCFLINHTQTQARHAEQKYDGSLNGSVRQLWMYNFLTYCKPIKLINVVVVVSCSLW